MQASGANLSDGALLSVVIAYENPAAGLHALRQLKEMMRDSHPGMELQLEVWQLERFADPDWRDTAAIEAAGADLLVIATGCPGVIPPAAEKWLASCLAARPGRPTMVVAFFGTDEPWTIQIEGQVAVPAVRPPESLPGSIAPALRHEHPVAA